jgi:hypothetical protein
MHSLLPRKIEVVLCCIKIYSNGMVIVKPDFNSTKKPYVVETGGFANGIYYIYLNLKCAKPNKIKHYFAFYKKHMSI